MRCAGCERDNPAGSRFCLGCGRSLEISCPACGSALPADAAFCNGCGAPVEADTGAPPAPAPEPPASGERRQATVLFSDLVGFTVMTETLDPEEVQGLMRRLKDRAVGIVEQHGGIVSQFVGDEVLALFGVPTAHEDDPVRAVRAARALHELAHGLSGEVEGRIGRPLRLHTGIDSGLVVTSTADDRDGRVGVTGDTVNTAARLKTAATADAVLLSPETHRRVAGFFEAEPQPPLELKGKAEALVPHRVLGEKAVATRFEAAAARGLTPFTGREAELATLRGCLERAMAGAGQVVTVMGEAGVGKSRLMYEFRQTIDRQRVTVIEGRCQSYGAETPYLPLLDALRRGLRLHELSDPAALHDTAAANIRDISPDLEPYLPHLLHLLSIPSDSHRLPESLQGDALRRELESALAAATTLNTRNGPMVAIYEDWHWADEASDAALQTLVGLVGHHPLLLVVLYRPEYPRKWAALEHYTSIVLHALDVPHTEQMLRSVWDVDALPEGLGAAVHARTGGNALFNEELAHALRESGGVAIDDGAARLARPLDALALPDSVHAVIRSRVDRLDSGDREVLRLASVIGREFDRAVLEHVAASHGGIPAAQVARALERLARQDLVHPVRVVPQAEYLFKHVLTQEVVYETLLLAQRKTLHAAVGAAIEALYADRSDEVVGDLAYHYARSNHEEKAVEFLEKAGDKACKTYSLIEGRRHYLEALQIVRRAPNTDEHRTRCVDLTIKWADRAHKAYEPERSDFEIVQSALADAELLGRLPQTAMVTLLLGRMHYYSGHLVECLEYFQQCVRWADVLNDDHLLAVPLNAMARSLIFDEQFRRCVVSLDEAILVAQRVGETRELAISSFYRGIAQGWLGDFLSAFADTDRAVAVAVDDGDRFQEVWATYATGFVRYQRGDWADGLSRMQKAKALAEQNDMEAAAAVAMAVTGYLICMAGDRARGVSEMRAATKLMESSDHKFLLSIIYGMLTEIMVLSGHWADALVTGNNARAMMRPGMSYGSCVTERGMFMAVAVASPTDWPEVANLANAALRLSAEKDSLTNTALNSFRYAECLHKMGDLEAAREQVDQAEALFRDMGMDWWTEQAKGLRGRLASGEPFVWFAPYVDGPPTVDA